MKTTIALASICLFALLVGLAVSESQQTLENFNTQISRQNPRLATITLGKPLFAPNQKTGSMEKGLTPEEIIFADNLHLTAPEAEKLQALLQSLGCKINRVGGDRIMVSRDQGSWTESAKEFAAIAQFFLIRSNPGAKISQGATYPVENLPPIP